MFQSEQPCPVTAAVQLDHKHLHNRKPRIRACERDSPAKVTVNAPSNARTHGTDLHLSPRLRGMKIAAASHGSHTDVAQSENRDVSETWTCPVSQVSEVTLWASFITRAHAAWEPCSENDVFHYTELLKALPSGKNEGKMSETIHYVKRSSVKVFQRLFIIVKTFTLIKMMWNVSAILISWEYWFLYLCLHQNTFY